MSKRISFSTNLDFSNPGMKPLRKKKKSPFYTTIIGKCCSSQKFLFWELCRQFCLMCQCQQPIAVSFSTTVNLPFSLSNTSHEQIQAQDVFALHFRNMDHISPACGNIYCAQHYSNEGKLDERGEMSEEKCNLNHSWYLTILWYLVVSCVYWHPVI